MHRLLTVWDDSIYFYNDPIFLIPNSCVFYGQINVTMSQCGITDWQSKCYAVILGAPHRHHRHTGDSGDGGTYATVMP